MTNGWWRLAFYLRPHFRQIALSLGLSLFVILLEVARPWPLKMIIDNVLTGTKLPPAITSVLPPSATESPQGLLLLLTLLLVFVQLLAKFAAWANQVLQARQTGEMQCALGLALFERLQELTLEFHSQSRKGDLLRRVMEDTHCLPTLLFAVLIPALTSIASLFVIAPVMWELNPTLTLVALVTVAPMAGLMRLFGSVLSKRSLDHQEKEAQVWSIVEQSLSALPIIQTFGAVNYQQSIFRGFASDTARAYMRMTISQLQFKFSLDAIETTGVATIMLVGGARVLAGDLTAGSLVIFLGYLRTLYEPLNSLANLSSVTSGVAGSLTRVLQVMDEKRVLSDNPGARTLPVRDNQRGAHLRFQQVSYGYIHGKPVLNDVTFELQPGEKLALVGPTGAGKTTLVSMIPRLLDPWRGQVFIDGEDVKAVKLSSVRSAVAYVLQDAFLLPVSIEQNIAYGNPAATQREIRAAAVAANAHEFIENLPGGYSTVIGERGATLSGGQRQRIAIARALLKDAPILILDEPTSALDVHTEHKVMQALERLTEGRTTIIIAHRLSTVKGADQVAVLRAGSIEEYGAPDALLKRDGLFAQMRRASHIHADAAVGRLNPS